MAIWMFFFMEGDVFLPGRGRFSFCHVRFSSWQGPYFFLSGAGLLPIRCRIFPVRDWISSCQGPDFFLYGGAFFLLWPDFFL